MWAILNSKVFFKKVAAERLDPAVAIAKKLLSCSRKKLKNTDENN